MVKSQVLKTVRDIDVQGKRVLVRLDLDVPLSEVRSQKSEVGDRRSPACRRGREVGIADDTRLVNELPTIEYLLDRQAKITVIGHLGKPNGKMIEGLRVEPVRKWFELKFPGSVIRIEENLRFDPGEEANSQSFAEDIVRHSGAEVYVFEAFATAHQRHASIISVPKLVAETAVGFRFAEEIRNLSRIWQNPKRPVVLVLGGAKLSTKLPLIEKLTQAADRVLLGGLFPTQVQSSKFHAKGRAGKVQSYSSKLKIAELNSGGTDISEKFAAEFADIIMKAGTVVWNGPMGHSVKPINLLTHQRINESDSRGTSAWGTWVVAKAMRETGAFTVAGGGDTEAALTKLGGSEGIDWISSGGGAMLYCLAYHTLPFLEALK